MWHPGGDGGNSEGDGAALATSPWAGPGTPRATYLHGWRQSFALLPQNCGDEPASVDQPLGAALSRPQYQGGVLAPMGAPGAPGSARPGMARQRSRGRSDGKDPRLRSAARRVVAGRWVVGGIAGVVGRHGRQLDWSAPADSQLAVGPEYAVLVELRNGPCVRSPSGRELHW